MLGGTAPGTRARRSLFLFLELVDNTRLMIIGVLINTIIIYLLTAWFERW
jgi:hypothetical protein